MGGWLGGNQTGVGFPTPWIVGNETKWGAFHGYPMLGNPYIVRMERDMPTGDYFLVDSHDRPFYHHVVTWTRAPKYATYASRYYPYIRGMTMNGYMVYPQSDELYLNVTADAGAAPLNVELLCREASGEWTSVAALVVPSETEHYWSGLGCSQIYVHVGMAAPRVDAGQGLEITIQS